MHACTYIRVAKLWSKNNVHPGKTCNGLVHERAHRPGRAKPCMCIIRSCVNSLCMAGVWIDVHTCITRAKRRKVLNGRV